MGINQDEMNIKISIEDMNKLLVKDQVKLDKAYINFSDLINKKLPYKFSYLDDWLLKKSNLLIREIEEERTTYKVYKRGTIVKVDFGVNLGSEMSQVHFGIVVSNNDNPRNNVVTVVPLTSKKGKYNLNLETLVIKKMLDKIESEWDKLCIEAEINGNINKAVTKKLQNIISYYSCYIKNSYACINLMTTVSKTRIFRPINEYDIIGKERCSSDVLNKIDKEIIKQFTGKNNNLNGNLTKTEK